MYRTKQTTSQFRKARTRTLIQLGGLVEKSGLLEPLNINLGDNLQKDYQHQESTAILAGGLNEIKHRLYGDEAASQKVIWLARGKTIFD